MYERGKLLPLPVSEPIPQEPWRKALLDAAEYIRVHGWIQRDFESLSGEVCALRAISRVSDGAIFSDGVDRLADHLECHSIIAWNDAPFQTAEDVIRALTDCARS